jgi:hypothetical protein
MPNCLIIGDWGRKGTDGQLGVIDGMARVAERLESRFVVTTGDNFYDGVTSLNDAHWEESYGTVYSATSVQILWYVVLGNHDYHHDLQNLAADGVDYVSGAGAEWRESGWCRESRYSVSKLGFSAVSLTADRLRVEFYDADGKRLYEAGKRRCSLASEYALSS